VSAPASHSQAGPIGGFFEEAASPAPAEKGRSILDVWTKDRPFGAFVNARSALAALVAGLAEGAVWLPAFLCRDLAAPEVASRVRLYPVLEGFEPDVTWLDREARRGDLVVLVAYFGLPFSAAVRDFASARRDLRFCEDRAQALDAGPGVDAEWRLYSPRKLLNVADGGLIVGRTDAATPQPTGVADAEALWAAPRLRARNPHGAEDGSWHAANQAKERSMRVSAAAMTPQSLALLRQTAIGAVSSVRLANWSHLDQALRSWSALPRTPTAPPLGYVLDLPPPTRDRVLSGLHGRRIFAAVHWPEPLGAAESFPREAEWGRRLLTLPCDHRYGEVEMDRIASAVLELLE
jgi:hypothetical protein